MASRDEDEEIANEVERRVQAQLEEEGENPLSDSDHAMFLRQDIRVAVLAERRSSEKRDLYSELMQAMGDVKASREKALGAPKRFVQSSFIRLIVSCQGVEHRLLIQRNATGSTSFCVKSRSKEFLTELMHFAELDPGRVFKGSYNQMVFLDTQETSRLLNAVLWITNSDLDDETEDQI